MATSRRGALLGVERRRWSARDADAQPRSRLHVRRDRNRQRADAGSGAVIWSRNAATDTGEEVPVWAFASSPLVVGDLVVIAAAGRLVAYDAATGEQRWMGPTGGAGYSSPHFATIDGVPQILLLRGSRTISVAPADGSLLWEHRWEPGVGIVQPAVADKDGVLLTTSDAMGGVGMRRIAVSRSPSGGPSRSAGRRAG